MGLRHTFLGYRDDDMAYKALQNVLLSLQEQGTGAEEGRGRLPQLLSSSRVLQDAGWPDARSRLMQPFSPAPLTDDPTWRLPAPQVPTLSLRFAGLHVQSGGNLTQFTLQQLQRPRQFVRMVSLAM